MKNKISLIAGLLVCTLPVSAQTDSEPASNALMIPLQQSTVSVVYDPSNSVFFDEDGIRGTSNGLTIDLGEIDFGQNQYDRIWVEMSYTGNISQESNFEFYLDDELLQPKTDLSIPLNIPTGSYDSEKTPQTGMFFKNQQTSEITVFDTRGDDNVSKMVSCVMQGILNQEYARVYLGAEDHHYTQLDDAEITYTVEPKFDSNKYGGFGSIIQKYKNQFEKLVVWTEDKDWTWCLAQMIAAQQKGIPVTEELKDFIVSEFGWDKEIYDTRNLWNNKSAAYQWALDNLSANCHPKLSFSAGLRSDYKDNPWRIYDYAAASKGFVFFLSELDSGEKAILENIFRTMNYEVGSSTMGYGASHDGDGLNAVINKYNVGFMVSDYYSNGSFWCAYPPKSFKQREGQAIDAQAGKIYVSFIWSDGDNIQFDSNQMYNMFKKAKRRGDVPVGMTMAASLQEVNPFLLEFFYKNRTANDELMAGPSGFQFIYGDSFNESTYSTWLATNKIWMETAGFHTACLWNTHNQTRFDEYMRTCGLQGVFDGWSNANNKYVGGVVAVNQGAHCSVEGDVYNDLIKAVPNASKPVFRNVYLIAANYGGADGYERLIRELERLEAHIPNTYTYLLPMDLCATLKKYIDENGGSY